MRARLSTIDGRHLDMASDDKKIVLDVHDTPKPATWVMLSLQHLFAMFGATILVPYLTGLSPAIALVSSGLGTLAYLVITRGRIPAYLGSSFAFIAPIVAAKAAGGVEGAMFGAFCAGLVYGVVALLIRAFGVRWLLRLLPPVVVGPVIMVIGLGLASVAVDMAMNDPAAQAYSGAHFAVALITLAATIVAAVFMRGIFGILPILVGIVVGYLSGLSFGIIDTGALAEASMFTAPDFVIPFVTYTPELWWGMALLLVPVSFVTIAEHIGDQMVLSRVIGRNLLEQPGLHRSLLGDGVATMIAALLGGPPNTTYGENIGVVAITRVFSVFVIGGAAVFALVFGFSGYITALISTIPTAVMGGVSILLFGIIASSGLRTMIDGRVDLGDRRNLIISSVILVIGVGGAVIKLGGGIELAGMGLAAIVGIVLNLILRGREEEPDLALAPQPGE